jgi:hypothetical protein
MSHMQQELFTLPKTLRVGVTRSLFFCVVFCTSLFVIWSFFFFLLSVIRFPFLIIPLVSSNFSDTLWVDLTGTRIHDLPLITPQMRSHFRCYLQIYMYVYRYIYIWLVNSLQIILNCLVFVLFTWFCFLLQLS